jgi:hypothetical protein
MASSPGLPGPVAVIIMSPTGSPEAELAAPDGVDAPGWLPELLEQAAIIVAPSAAAEIVTNIRFKALLPYLRPVTSW